MSLLRTLTFCSLSLSLSLTCLFSFSNLSILFSVLFLSYLPTFMFLHSLSHSQTHTLVLSHSYPFMCAPPSCYSFFRLFCSNISIPSMWVRSHNVLSSFFFFFFFVPFVNYFLLNAKQAHSYHKFSSFCFLQLFLSSFLVPPPNHLFFFFFFFFWHQPTSFTTNLIFYSVSFLLNLPSHLEV